MARRSLLIIFLIALLLRLALWWHNPMLTVMAQMPDSPDYLRLAVALREGQFPSLIRTPVYPLFLVLTGASSYTDATATYLFQIIIDATTGLLLTLITWKLTASKRAALGAGFLWAACPVAMTLTNMVMTETVFLFMVTLACYLALTKSAITGSLLQGICWTMAVLTRPAGALLPVIVGGCLLFSAPHREQRRRQIGALLVYICLLGVWIGFNYYRSGLPNIAAISDVAFYIYEVPAAMMAEEHGWPKYGQAWLFNSGQAEEARETYQAKFTAELQQLNSAVPNNLWDSGDNLPLMLWLKEQALARLGQQPQTVLGTHLVGALQALRPVRRFPHGGLAMTLLDALRILLLPAALVCLAWRRQWWLLVFLGLWLGYALLLPGVCSNWRHRAMAEPAISLALATLPWLLHKVKVMSVPDREGALVS